MELKEDYLRQLKADFKALQERIESRADEAKTMVRLERMKTIKTGTQDLEQISRCKAMEDQFNKLVHIRAVVDTLVECGFDGVYEEAFRVCDKWDKQFGTIHLKFTA